MRVILEFARSLGNWTTSQLDVKKFSMREIKFNSSSRGKSAEWERFSISDSRRYTFSSVCAIAHDTYARLVAHTCAKASERSEKRRRRRRRRKRRRKRRRRRRRGGEEEEERIGALWSRKINRTTRTRFQPWLLISGLPNDLFPHMSSCDYASPAVIFQCNAVTAARCHNSPCHSDGKRKKERKKK